MQESRIRELVSRLDTFRGRCCCCWCCYYVMEPLASTKNLEGPESFIFGMFIGFDTGVVVVLTASQPLSEDLCVSSAGAAKGLEQIATVREQDGHVQDGAWVAGKEPLSGDKKAGDDGKDGGKSEKTDHKLRQEKVHHECFPCDGGCCWND